MSVIHCVLIASAVALMLQAAYPPSAAFACCSAFCTPLPSPRPPAVGSPIAPPSRGQLAPPPRRSCCARRRLPTRQPSGVPLWARFSSCKEATLFRLVTAVSAEQPHTGVHNTYRTHCVALHCRVHTSHSTSLAPDLFPHFTLSLFVRLPRFISSLVLIPSLHLNARIVFAVVRGLGAMELK